MFNYLDLSSDHCSRKRIVPDTERGYGLILDSTLSSQPTIRLAANDSAGHQAFQFLFNPIKSVVKSETAKIQRWSIGFGACS